MASDHAWHHIDNDSSDEHIWQQSITSELKPTQSKLPWLLSHKFVYEFILLFVIVCAAVGMLFWQWSETRMSNIEKELEQLQADMLMIQQNILVSSPVVNQDGNDVDLTPLAIIETEHFRFIFPREYARIVATAATTSDTQYDRLYQGWKLRSEKHFFDVHVKIDAYTMPRVRYPSVDEFSLELSLSTQLAANDVLATAEVLNRELISQLARRGLDEILIDREIMPQWQAIVDSLYVYFWRYQFQQPNWPRNHFYESRRRAQYLSLNITNEIETALPDHLEGATGSKVYRTYMIADPLVEFIVVHYGIDYVPKMVSAFSHHQTWDTLAPTVFNISADELETKWHAYLQQHYPAS